MDDTQVNWAWQQRSSRQVSGRPIGTILDGFAGSAWLKQHSQLRQIVGALESLLPSDLLARVAIDGFKRNTLHLRTDSAGHRFELERVKGSLVSSLNDRLSGLFVRDIRLNLGPLGNKGGSDRRRVPPRELH